VLPALNEAASGTRRLRLVSLQRLPPPRSTVTVSPLDAPSTNRAALV